MVTPDELHAFVIGTKEKTASINLKHKGGKTLRDEIDDLKARIDKLEKELT